MSHDHSVSSSLSLISSIFDKTQQFSSVLDCVYANLLYILLNTLYVHVGFMLYMRLLSTLKFNFIFFINKVN